MVTILIMKKDSYLIADYMQSNVTRVSPETTVKEVTEIMLKRKTNGVVVIDSMDTVVGILSSWDIIKHIVPDYLEQDKHLAPFEAAHVFADRIKEVANDPVSKFMTKDVHTAKKDDSLMKAITLLSEFHIRQLPIVDNDNKLIGYINRTDVKRAAGDVLRLNYSD